MSIEPIVSSSNLVCFVGGGPLENDAISAIFASIDAFIGVDGGADHLLAAGMTPAAVIGDMDSLSDHARATFADILCHVSEQSTTDFEKALVRVKAPMILALGFTGGRMDHTLSVLNVLTRHPDRAVVLVDEDGVCFIATIGLTVLDVPNDTRVSLMPLGRAVVTATGLRWPFADTVMTPDGFTSPSNAALESDVEIQTDGPVLITLPRAHLPVALKAASRAE